ncbi:MAG TPA: DUF4402 domain-containing protein [Sphingomicrobium sp.]|nr:DUF4402 domain-containing protein [Sphingomicrobium sp.]
MDYRYFTIAAAAALSFATPAIAAPVPATADASGKAILLIPLTLTKIDDLDFGTMISESSSGTVSLDASNSSRLFAGGVTGVTSAVGHRAYFGGAGSPGQQVIVTISAPATLANSNGDKITVLALTQDGSPIRTIDPVARTFFVGIGGILMLGANQPDGDYSANFSVTAQYQ